MRYIALRNKAGEEKPVNGEFGIWFSNITGLGIANEINKIDLGSGFFRNLDTGHPPSQSVPGDIFIMPPDADRKYREFLNWLQAAGELTIIYRPYGTETFYRAVRLEYLQKGVPEKTGRLVIPTSFLPLTPWYKPAALTLVIQPAETNITTFPFTLTDDLHFPSGTGTPWSAEILSSGHLDAALRFDYSGEAENPVLTITGINSGIEYGRCAVSGTVNGLSFSSVPYDKYVRDGNGNSLYDNLTPGVDPYVRIPIGDPCTLDLVASNELTGSASASVYYYYRSV